MPVAYIPHGGGPLPLMSCPNHANMIPFLSDFSKTWLKVMPKMIIMVSAHWESNSVSITGSGKPELYFDYGGFPAETYQYKYPSPGDPEFAQTLQSVLKKGGIEAKVDNNRGYDHGMFVPMMMMFPKADIPCVQVSLLKSMDPGMHIKLGEVLSPLITDEVLLVGSGFSFHGGMGRSKGTDPKNEAFEEWLRDAITNEKYTPGERTALLNNWESAPHSRYCHPREEHLIPLHVCAGAAKNTPGTLMFDAPVMGKRVSGYFWK
eukprot:TRINITY_DN1491_c5_g1_i1.p1 TRINITY_DN1491_c5_g1~~TRINITY_DN1491_c5_g1_i1.p1  ORF type:complete len:262 (+),score=38.35 TRINITY_DN1491_c5_g1_i1:56-841(+)